VLEESGGDIRGYSNATKEFYRDIVTTDVLQGVHVHAEILAGIGVEYGKKWLSANKSSNISFSRDKGFDWCQKQRPWMTLKGHYAPSFETRAPWCCYLVIYL